MTNLVARALLLSQAQLEALQRGDFDGYLAGLDAQEEACLGLRASVANLSDQAVAVRELLAVNEAIVAELRAHSSETSARLANLARQRAGAEAYLQAPPFAPLRTRSA